MSKQIYRVRNWKEYNTSLINRGNITFWVAEEIEKDWYYQDKRKRGGIVKYSNVAITVALTLRNLFKMPLRATEGLLRSLIKLSGIAVDTPNYTTLSRRATGLEIKFQEQKNSEPLHILIDSTGINVYGESAWKSVKHGTYRYQVWRKLHIIMDLKSQVILNAEYSESQMQDAKYLAPLVEAVQGNIDEIIGDGAYDKRRCYRKAHEIGAKLIVPPQHGAIVQRNRYKKEEALLPRDDAIREIKEQGIKEWKKRRQYHRRSLAEAMMFRIKTVFGEMVRSKKFENQRTDMLIRCMIMNKMTALGLPDGEMIPV